MTIVETVELVTGLCRPEEALEDLEIRSFDFEMVAVVLEVMEELATMTLVVMEFTLPFVMACAGC